MDSEFLILKWELIENNLSEKEIDLLYDLVSKVTDEECEDDDYCVLKRSYIEGKKLAKKFDKERKIALIEKLNELATLSSSEIAHIEADEALLDYIYDKDVSSAFDKVRKNYG